MLKNIGIKINGINWRHLLVDLPIVSVSFYLSIYLRVGPDDYWDYFPAAHNYVLLALVCRFLVFLILQNYNVLWRFFSAFDVFRLTQAVFLSTVLIISVSFLFSDHFGRVPRSVYFIDAMVVMFMLLGARLGRRLQYEMKHGFVRTGNDAKAIIFGAGANGKTLAARFKMDPALNCKLVGFLDDDKNKVGLKINDVSVIGGIKDLERAIEKTGATRLYVAISRCPNTLLQEIVKICAKKHIKPRLISQFSDTDGRIEITRKPELKDLLNRPPRDLDLQKIEQLIRDKRILITGAGGSIGAELSRQVLGQGPKRLVLLDHSEYNLFEIDRELRQTTQSIAKIVPVLADLKDERAIHMTVKKYMPDVIIHAAAYKHVHLVEINPYSAILNNIQGTWNLLKASMHSSVESFVLISTDKAVNPGGIMGATKRVCELLVTTFAVRTGKAYSSVRFGNVLGSSGSLIPTLEKQVSQGGPVTVTHKDMTRFFMLIPEAVSLVLTAASLSKPGDINVLKMGNPVKILDIAKSVIALCGKTEDEVPIVFTGVRPGEKMYEELYIRGDELKTDHPDVVTLPNGDAHIFESESEINRMEKVVASMVECAERGDEKAVHLLNELAKPQFSFSKMDEHNKYEI